MAFEWAVSAKLQWNLTNMPHKTPSPSQRNKRETPQIVHLGVGSILRTIIGPIER